MSSSYSPLSSSIIMLINLSIIFKNVVFPVPLQHTIKFLFSRLIFKSLNINKFFILTFFIAIFDISLNIAFLFKIILSIFIVVFIYFIIIDEDRGEYDEDIESYFENNKIN